ncbi:MAG: hypothetical protein WC139_04940, partial [Candidatus Kapaibacterium sp.]
NYIFIVHFRSPFIFEIPYLILEISIFEPLMEVRPFTIYRQTIFLFSHIPEIGGRDRRGNFLILFSILVCGWGKYICKYLNLKNKKLKDKNLTGNNLKDNI